MLNIGMELKHKHIVKEDETAKFVGSGGLDVFSTPSLLALMEYTAYNLVQSSMEEGMTTVGIGADLKHLKANLVGEDVVCTATLTQIDGKKLTFDIIVEAGDTILGSCKHERFIINEEKFLGKLKK